MKFLGKYQYLCNQFGREIFIKIMSLNVSKKTTFSVYQASEYVDTDIG